MLTHPRCKKCESVIRNIITMQYFCEKCIKEGVNMIPEIKIGVTLKFGGEEFQIVDIHRKDSIDGKMLHITAYDPASADKIQQMNIKTTRTGEGAVDIVQDIIDRARKGKFGFGGE